jgi:hypothetical protein
MQAFLILSFVLLAVSSHAFMPASIKTGRHLNMMMYSTSDGRFEKKIKTAVGIVIAGLLTAGAPSFAATVLSGQVKTIETPNNIVLTLPSVGIFQLNYDNVNPINGNYIDGSTQPAVATIIPMTSTTDITTSLTKTVTYPAKGVKVQVQIPGLPNPFLVLPGNDPNSFGKWKSTLQADGRLVLDKVN